MQTDDVMENVRRALGRRTPLTAAPRPPAIDEVVVRLVHTDIGLPELFVAQARKSAMGAELVRPEELCEKIIEDLRRKNCRSIAMASCRLFDGLNLGDALRQAGFDVHRWSELTADEVFDFDCGLTDVYAAVAETGSLVMRARADHGRLLSLAPPIHVAVVEPRLIVPDLVDLMSKLSGEARTKSVTLITGPSKTSDIEGKLVIGVHGPETVQILVLR